MFSIRKLIPFFRLLWTEAHRSLSITLLLIVLSSIFYGCRTTSLISADADFERGEYFEAQKKYRELIKKLNGKDVKSERAAISLKLGECYLKLNQTERAYNALFSAYRNGNDSPQLFYLLTETSIRIDKIPDAHKFYELFIDADKNNDYASQKEHLTSMLRFLELNKNEAHHIIKEANFMNGRRSNFSPIVNPLNHDEIYFTSTEEYSMGENRSGITGMKNCDIWHVIKDDKGRWSRPAPLGVPINSEYDDGIMSIAPSGDVMFFTRSRRDENNSTNIQIWQSKRISAQWDEPTLVLSEYNDSIYNFGHPAVGDDGFLYFASDRPGGFGGYDIWRTPLSGDFSVMENLGDKINTGSDELFPYMLNDSTLYFSSNGHPGFGALDIFIAKLDNDMQWNVANPGKPLNSSADDFGIAFISNNNGFISSNRGDNRGYDHIFQFTIPEQSCVLKGYVMDTEEYALPGIKLRLIGDDGSIKQDISKTDGSYSFNLSPEVKYLIQAGGDGYLNANTSFTAHQLEDETEYNIDFILIPFNKPVEIDNIYYDYNKFSLREDSKYALDSLAAMLERFPSISIKIMSHTDRIGSDQYNDNLSLQRAKSVVDYLIEFKGIKPERLLFEGVGKRHPQTITPRLNKKFPQFEENTVLTPEFIDSINDESMRDNADQINRRTEFEIVTSDYLLL